MWRARTDQDGVSCKDPCFVPRRTRDDLFHDVLLAFRCKRKAPAASRRASQGHGTIDRIVCRIHSVVEIMRKRYNSHLFNDRKFHFYSFQLFKIAMTTKGIFTFFQPIFCIATLVGIVQRSSGSEVIMFVINYKTTSIAKVMGLIMMAD